MVSFQDLAEKPYIIAELSSNHANDINIVLKSIEAASRAGASAIKTQLFTADSLAFPDRTKSVKISDKNSPWYGQSLFDLYEEAALPYEWYPAMIKCAKANSIDLFSSVFDKNSVDFALSLDFSFIKISSFELINTPLLNYAEQKNIPCIVSTGMSNLNEIEECVDIFKNDKRRLCLLKCTSDYPASIESTHVAQMKEIANKFNLPVGLSDHSLSNLPSIIATTLGASIIEKHFILDKNLKTPDSFFSLDEFQFKSLVNDIKATKLMISNKDLNEIKLNVEEHSAWERPSLYFSRDISKGEAIKNDDLIIRRPSLGLKPNFLEKLIGKILIEDVKEYQPTDLNLFM